MKSVYGPQIVRDRSMISDTASSEADRKGLASATGGELD
jgi:hypothetical protein